MKIKFVFLLILTMMVSSSAFAAVDATANLAAGKTVYGTFTNQELVTNGKLAAPGATSGDISESPQYLNIDLGGNMYLDRIKIFWDKDAYSDDFMIKTSSDSKTWQDEAAHLDASTGAVDAASGTISTSIALTRAMINSRYIQIIVPAGSMVTNTKGSFVKINEVQVFPAVNQTFNIVSVESYVVTDNMCAVKYRTSLGTAGGTLNFGTDPNVLDRVAGNCDSGIDNSIVLLGLQPKTNYFFQIKATDYYGNSISSKVYTFQTEKENIALKKPVSGTFTFLPPNDKYVQSGSQQDILARITDGGTSYFTSMATSGPISGGDQSVTIDLGRQFNIKTVYSYWRSLAYPESLSVSVSDDNVAWKEIGQSQDAGAGASARSDAGDPMKVLRTNGALGRYVRLTVKQGSPFFHKHAEWDFVQLMEVQVFAE